MNESEHTRQYLPIYALPYWDTIGRFVTEAVSETAASTGRTEQSLFPAATAFVLWCWQSRGTPLERPRIFRKAFLEEFVHLGMGRYSVGSRATHRATLSLMITTLNPAGAYPERRPLSRSKPTKPYSAQEVAALYSWATTQGTARRRQDAVGLLALGLGAGLATRELLGVRRSDVDLRNDLLQVIVWEGRARVVPVRSDWQRPLVRMLDGMDADAWVFRPGRRGPASGQITDFMMRARTDLDVRPSPMRATWLLHHLLAGTPPQELLRISGLKNLAALDKIVIFAPAARNSKDFLLPD